MPKQFEEGITLDRFLMDQLREYPGATGQFINLTQSIALAGKMISARVNRMGLAGMVGATGEINVQGEFVQKLDVYANQTFIRALEHRGHTCMVVSEEEGELVLTPTKWHSGRYVVTVDPLDGSSNIDVNATIGTIFGIYRRKSPEGGAGELSDVLRPGRELAAAGYILYGSGTMLVLAIDRGVFGFSLDPTVGEFFLSHPTISVPCRGTIFSLNEGYASEWGAGLTRYIASLKAPGKKYSARHIGSLVADFHRNLLKGGIYLYPPTASAPQGKLRLLYEAAPLAYIIEKAGGSATDGQRSILDIQPKSIHHRVPLVIGGTDEVREATLAMREDFPLS